MARRLAAFSVAALGALCGLSAQAETFDVRIQDYEYIPGVLTIAPGDTVRWTSYAPDHTVTSDLKYEDGGFDSSTTLPDAAIPVFGVFTVTFTTAGEYKYYCQVHGGPGSVGMSAKIRVVAAGSNNPPSKPANVAPLAGAMNVSKSPLLEASVFVDGDVGDSHVASQWVITKVSDGSVVFDTGGAQDYKLSYRPLNLANSVSYSWQVRYQDASGAWSEYSDPTTFTTVGDITGNATFGLKGSYGSYVAKTGLNLIKGSRVDSTINFDWKAGKAYPSAPANNFYVKWEGSVLPPSSETYLFRTVADGGMRLRINGVLIIDDWKTATFPVYRAGAAALEAGVPVPIVLEYFDTTGNAAIQLRWISPTHPLEVIPQSNLIAPAL